MLGSGAAGFGLVPLGLGLARLAGPGFLGVACCLVGWLLLLVAGFGFWLLGWLSFGVSVPPCLAFVFARPLFPASSRFLVGLWFVCFFLGLLRCPPAFLLPPRLRRLLVLRRVSPAFVCPRGGLPGLPLAFVRSLFLCSFCLVACCVGCRFVGRASGAFSVLRSPCSFACWCWPAPLLLACESAASLMPVLTTWACFFLTKEINSFLP